jgi:hypothetical protein
MVSYCVEVSVVERVIGSVVTGFFIESEVEIKMKSESSVVNVSEMEVVISIEESETILQA